MCASYVVPEENQGASGQEQSSKLREFQSQVRKLQGRMEKYPKSVTKLNSRDQLVACLVLTKYPRMGDNTVTSSGATPKTNPAM